MPFRKTSQSIQPHNQTAHSASFDATSLSPSKASISPQPKSSPKTKKPAWLDAPLPQFYDQELAAEMVQQGHYKTFEEAFIEVPEHRLNSIRAKLMNT